MCLDVVSQGSRSQEQGYGRAVHHVRPVRSDHQKDFGFALEKPIEERNNDILRFNRPNQTTGLSKRLWEEKEEFSR